MPILVSVLMPLYNEEEYLAAILDRVLKAPLPDGAEREIILVDDGSSDASVEIAEEMARQHPGVIRLIKHAKNQGKGAAIRTAIKHARGEYSIIQDADLEYDPKEFPRMLSPLFEGKADVVYGSRFVVAGERRVLYFWHAVANQLLTLACNVASDLNLTDMETCYKAFRTTLAQSIPIRSNRFGIEPEITIKFAKRQVRIYETPISYYGRTYDEGKKIGLKDAFQAIWVIVTTAFSNDIYSDAGPEILDAIASAPRFNRWMADTVQPYIGKDVLEIGAGIGNLTRELSRRRRTYVAGDIDREHMARLRNRFQHRPNVRVAHCDLTKAEDFVPFAGAMDTVVCMNVLEHVQDDMAGLRNIHAVLRAGGRAVILVPQGQEIYGTLDEALGHFRRYSQEELKSKMEAGGFAVERIIEFNRITRPAWYITGRMLRQRTLRPLQLKVFDKFVGLWRKIDESLPWPAASIIAIGVKR